MHPLSRLEARMEMLVEGTLARWLGNRLHPHDVGVQLARALEDSARQGQPATRYQVRLNPADAQGLGITDPALATQLADNLLTLAREAQIALPEHPTILFETDPQLPRHQVKVQAQAAPPLPSSTQSMTPVRPTGPLTMPKAYVILNGHRMMPLVLPVINLGRRLDNQIVLDDPRASRVHAQLRLRFGRYVLYDLGSTTGTQVNGQPITECVLRPGDVISLGNTTLIYGEEEAPQRSTFETTQPGRPLTRPGGPHPET